MVRRCRGRHARSHDSRTGLHCTASPAAGPATRSPGTRTAHSAAATARRQACGDRRRPGRAQQAQQHRSTALEDRPRRPDRRCRRCCDRLSAAAPAPGRLRRRIRAVEHRGRDSSHDYCAVPLLLIFSCAGPGPGTAPRTEVLPAPSRRVAPKPRQVAWTAPRGPRGAGHATPARPANGVACPVPGWTTPPFASSEPRVELSRPGTAVGANAARAEDRHHQLQFFLNSPPVGLATPRAHVAHQ
jgi:hypothetical protein